eukprot:669219-Pelagomonas_calceolata.AAC.1
MQAGAGVVLEVGALETVPRSGVNHSLGLHNYVLASHNEILSEDKGWVLSLLGLLTALSWVSK